MINENVESIKNEIKDFKATLIAVSKQQPDDRIEDALNLGLRVFGENKVQEAEKRWSERRAHYSDLELHLIGPLQTNKVRQAIDLFDCIHTLDREKLARAIHKYAPEMPCFIQVNIGAEPQKSGILIDDLPNFYKFCTDLGMNIIGLMCIPPIDDNPETHFQSLTNHAKKLGLKHLSMGMSNDFDIALRNGATHIRVGSGIFGERQ